MNDNIIKKTGRIKTQQTALPRDVWVEVKALHDITDVDIQRIAAQAINIGLPILKERYEKLNLTTTKVA